jgi:hypothetical protein
MLKPILRCLGTVLGSFAAFTSIAVAAPGDGIRQAVAAQAQVNDASAKSQTTVSQLSDETQRLLEEYLQSKEQVDRLRVYNQNLTNLVRDQQEQLSSIDRQMKDVDIVEKEIVPLMLRMVTALEQFVKLDLPFLGEERTNRVVQLKDMMNRSDVTISEKYRRVMEAYQIETEYGRTIEAYRGRLKGADGSEREVDFLRVGRLVLAYQTLDKEETGFWNASTKQWQELSGGYEGAITSALRVARKQSAPDLINLPILAPEAAK